MSFYVHVKHHLTPEGFDYFGGWPKQVHAFMSKNPGFVSLTSEQFRKKDMAHAPIDKFYRNRFIFHRLKLYRELWCHHYMSTLFWCCQPKFFK